MARGTLTRMSQPVAGGVIGTFRDFSRSTKVAIWVMLVLGVVLFAVCLIADLTGADWMKGYAYIPNILAGLTGFLVGVPFALVVLATLASQRDERAAADRVNAVSQIAWNQYHAAITTLCSPQRIEALKICAERIQCIHDETYWMCGLFGLNRSVAAFEEFTAFCQSQSQLWSEALGIVNQQVGIFAELRLQWLAALRDWNTLDQYVRLQRLERGLHWFERVLDSELQERMAADRHPMRSFFELHDSQDHSRDMFGAWRTTDWLGRQSYSEDVFDELLQHIGHEFPNHPVEGYMDAANEAIQQMGLLYAIVEQIRRGGWPVTVNERANEVGRTCEGVSQHE